MGDLEDILYVVFLVIFFLFRLFRKKPEEQQAPSQPKPPPSAQPASPQKSIMDVIREEMERQKELNKNKPEIKQKSLKFKKAEKRVKTKTSVEFPSSRWSGVEASMLIDKVENEEGVSSLSGKQNDMLQVEQSEQETKFEFDPREAFMMKTLLERPYF